jgi:hypothetical protein
MVVKATEVHFADGSSWTSGQPYTKAYDNGGSSVPGTPTINPPSPSNTANTNNTSSNTASPVSPVNPAQPAAGSLQIGCTPVKGGNPIVITIDEVNKVVATTAGPNFMEYGKQVTAQAFMSATMISWTWPLTDRLGNIQQDSWSLNRSTLQADENHGTTLYQCSRNQI